MIDPLDEYHTLWKEKPKKVLASSYHASYVYPNHLIDHFLGRVKQSQGQMASDLRDARAELSALKGLPE